MSKTSTQNLTTLADLLKLELVSLYRNEVALAESLDRFRRSARNTVLAEYFERERRATLQVQEQLGPWLDARARKTGERQTLTAILEEANHRVQFMQDHHLVDAELIATMQKILHFQVAEYGTTKTLASLLGEYDLQTLAEQTIEQKIASIDLLTELALHQVHWRAAWWTNGHTSAWDRVKEAFKRDWKASFRRTDHTAGDTLSRLRSNGDGDPRDSLLLEQEPAFRYGYGAAVHYSSRSWDEELESELRTNYGGHWESSREPIRSGWQYQRKMAEMDEVDRGAV